MQLTKKLKHSLLVVAATTLCIWAGNNSALAQDNDVAEHEKAMRAHEKSNAVLPLPVELVEEVDDYQAPAAQSATESTATLQPATTPENLAPEKTELASANLENTKTTILNVNDVDIATLVKTFSKLTGRNYIVDSDVKGKITIHLPTPVTIEEALRIFDTVLLLRGFTTVPVTDNLWKVVKAKDAKQTTIPILSQSPENPSDTLVTQLINFRYVQAEDMQQLVQPFVSGEGSVTAYSGTNALIIIDSALNIARIMGLIEKLDVPASDQEITIIPILHATADAISEKINEILGENPSQAGATGQGQQNQARTIRAQLSNVQRQGGVGATVERRALPIKIIPDERTNSLIVVADPEMTARVQGLVEKLDSSTDSSSGRFYVYRLKHADSESIAEILTSLTSGASAESSSNSGKDSSVSGSSISRNRSSKSNAPGAAAEAASGLTSRLAEALRQRRGGTAQSDGNGGKVNFEGEVSITADPATNTLIINASRSDYQKVKEVLDAIDVQRSQVLVEATLLEISLTKEEGLGFEWQGTAGTNSGGVFAQTNYGGLTNVLTNPSALSDLTIAAASSGTVTLPGGIVLPSQAALITAVSSNQNVNVLSSPTIVATDNQEAQIIVGENVPFVTSTSTDNSNISNTFNQIERQDVGITLRITPQVSTGDFIVLKIFVEISNVVPGTRNDPNGPSTTIRTTETTVEVKNGQMIVTGGLISDSVSDATRGVPFLQDIPVLGHLFRRDDTSRRRTNLLVFITPRVLKNQFDAREEAQTRSKDMQEAIAEQGSKPSRDEVLESENLDKVVDQAEAVKMLPTRITPANESQAAAPGDVKFTQETLSEMEFAKRKAEQKANETITVIAKPKLPEKPALPTTPEKAPSAAKTKVDEPKQSASQDTSSLKTAAATKQYIVLRDISGGELPKSPNVPFAYSSDIGSLGLVVAQPANGAGSFFQVGRRYSFTLGDVERSFVCIGLYVSANEAAESHSELSEDTAKWYQLTDDEISNLGKQGWQPLS